MKQYHATLYRPMSPIQAEAMEACLAEISEEARADIEALLLEIEAVAKNSGAKHLGRHSVLELLGQAIRKGLI